METKDLENFGVLNFYQRRSDNNQYGQSKVDESSSAEIDPEIAKGLFEEGAVLIFLDVPERTEFGIDCSTWNVGEKFKGFKMIPPGIHFIYYSAVSRDNVTSLRTGFFYNFKRKEVVIKRWDKLGEGLSDDTITAEEQERFESNLKNLDGFLGPYPYNTYKKWVSLSKWITEKTISRLAPVGPHQLIFSVQQLESVAFSSSRTVKSDETSPKKLKPSSELPEMKVLEHTRIRFVVIPIHGISAGTSATDRTRLGMDKTDVLNMLISDSFENEEKEVLAEASFAFICFLIGQVFDAFEQWKRLIALMSGCEKAIRERPNLFLDFITMLYFQLHEIPRDFFVDIITQENFLTNTLQRFFASIETLEHVDSSLRKKALQFREHLQKYFKWDFTSELYDDAPVIVE